MAYYSIRADDQESWFKLAWQLALDHVPGFQVSGDPGPGRPRRPLTLKDGISVARKKRGPSTKWTPDLCFFVLAAREYGRRRLAKNGKRVTNAEAIAIAAKAACPDKNQSWCRDVGKHLAKRVSDCERILQKSSDNSA